MTWHKYSIDSTFDHLEAAVKQRRITLTQQLDEKVSSLTDMRDTAVEIYSKVAATVFQLKEVISKSSPVALISEFKSVMTNATWSNEEKKICDQVASSSGGDTTLFASVDALLSLVDSFGTLQSTSVSGPTLLNHI